jgi:elongation factor P hydroxylase
VYVTLSNLVLLITGIANNGMHTIQHNMPAWMDVFDIKEFIMWFKTPDGRTSKDAVTPYILLHRRKTMEGAKWLGLY